MTAPFARIVARTCACAVLGLSPLAGQAAAQSAPDVQPKKGGTLRMTTLSEPTTLNPYFSTDINIRMLDNLNLEGLTHVAQDGSFVPVLASEIPTQANGDVSTDGTVVTWKLKSGVVWSDGEPFTSQDVVFTYRMLMDPANPIIDRSDYRVMESVVAPDDTTVVVTYKQLYAPYRLAFPRIFPAHVFNGRTNIADDPFNQFPDVTTGPFVLTGAPTPDSITYVRNPEFREPGRPYLDEVVFKFTPNRDVAMQTLQAGEADADYFLDPSYLPQLGTMSDVAVDPAPLSVFQLFMNESCPTGPQQGDPSCPHPILGDLRVRQAIDMAIDKQALAQGLMQGEVQSTGSLLPAGAFRVDLPAGEFNPDGARQRLDQAGWTAGPDGIRTRDGARAHLSIMSGIGNRLVEQTVQVIQADLQDVGIETEGRQFPLPVLVGGFATNSPFFLGNFDMAVFMRAIPVDPQSYLFAQFASDQVPTPQVPGQNWDRVQDPRLDQALAAAAGTLDDGQRRAAYTTFSQLIQSDEAVIPLFPNLQVDARRSYVEGWGPTNINEPVTWNIQDWWLHQ
jgi:peptide/nickel transport system substrate-binding protein